MADEEKKTPRIDLRARLGRRTVGNAGPSIPPPMATGASIPAPPFASKAPPVMEAERPRVVEPQAIKIEMSEEVVAAQKKGRTKVIAIAVATAVVGAIIGTTLGQGIEKRKRQNIALEGAELLTDEIDEANLKIGEIAETVKKAKLALSDGEYPEAQVKELAELAIPFDGTYLVGKGTGLMSAKINRMLIDYAALSGQANEQKDSLQTVLSSARKPIEDLLEQKEKPKFNWSVYLMPGPHGPMASMQLLPEPFLVSSKEKTKNDEGKMIDYDWPDEIEVPDGDKKIKLKLYEDGNPIARTPMLIPVDPSSQAGVCPNDTMMRLRTELVKLEEVLKGDGEDKPGLVDLGKNLIDELKSIGVGG